MLHSIRTGLIMVFLMACSCQSENLINTTQKESPLPERIERYSSKEISEAKSLALTVPELRAFPSELKEKRRASIILSEYLVLSGHTYSLEISESKAAELGITSKLFKECEKEVKIANEQIQDLISKGAEVHLDDIQAIAKAYKSNSSDTPQLKLPPDDGNYFPGGCIITVGQEQGVNIFDTRLYHYGVIFFCRNNAAILSMCTCILKAFGVSDGEGVFSSCFFNRTVKAKMAASEDRGVAEVMFITADSNGGNAAWQVVNIVTFNQDEKSTN